MIAGGYQALRDGAALLDLRGRGLLRATGDDRARFLHAMTTNHVQQLEPGDFCYAFFLNAQGRVLADALLVSTPAAILIDTEPERRAFLQEHLDKFIIADDVTLEDISEQNATFGVEGPAASRVLTTIAIDPLPAPGKWISWQDWTVLPASVTGATGYRLYGPATEAEPLRRRLLNAGAEEATSEEIQTARIENAKPRYGDDLSDSYIPQETRQLHALHFSKGCYLGQEIVERVRSRGQVHRLLAQFVIPTEHPPDRGTKIHAGSADAGEITSAAYSPALDKVVALGYLRAEHISAKTPLTISGHPAEVTDRVPGASG
jgi:aminomethyltransferase